MSAFAFVLISTLCKMKELDGVIRKFLAYLPNLSCGGALPDGGAAVYDSNVTLFRLLWNMNPLLVLCN